MAEVVYDLLIIGAGPAGMTAAIYAGRSNLSVALIDKEGFGGNIAKSPRVENIPGFVSISGAEFAEQMYNQITNLPTITHFIEEIIYINYRYGLFILTTNNKETICGKSLIFATGTDHKKLDLPTKDIYYCATCDGPFFKNKNVIVVGSGNTGVTYAIELASYCKNVYLCDITFNMCCEPVLVQQALSINNIHWLPNSTIQKVTNNKEQRLSSVTLTTGNTLKCNAIFAAIGLTPQTHLAQPFVTLTEAKYIKSIDCSTDKVPGVFVAGDCRDNQVKQVVTAVADGATAALKAIKFIKQLNK